MGRSSRLTQRIHFTAVDGYIEFETTVDWAENRKFLKVEFPVNVHSHQVSITLPSCADFFSTNRVSRIPQ